jgi:hypothetical protein
MEKMKKVTKTKKEDKDNELLHKIQQPKMQELWDNKEDNAWGHA